MNYKIVIDSTVYLSQKEIKENGIKIASLNILDKDEVFKELDVDCEFVYGRLANGHHLTTSQPSPAEFFDIYEGLIKEGADKIFVVTLAPPLSGTFQSATIARTMLDEPNKIHVFESKMAAFGNEMLVIELIKMINEGKAEKEIINRITALNSEANLIFTVESLQHLARSGRLSKAKALIGTVLRVKPLIKMVDGKLDLFKSERTHKKVALSIIKNIVKSKIDASMMKFLLYNRPINSQILTEELVCDIVFEHKAFPEELFRQLYEIVATLVDEEFTDYDEYAVLQQKYFI